MKKVTEQEMENLINQLWLEFLSQATPLEIHQSVFTANWDGNRFLLNWIKDNPEVDKATILIAYWKSAPRWNNNTPTGKKYWSKQDGISTPMILQKKWKKIYSRLLEEQQHLARPGQRPQWRRLDQRTNGCSASARDSGDHVSKTGR